MQEQGKRLLLAVALALGVLVLWQWIFPPKKPPPKTGTGSGSALVQATPPSVVPGTTPAAPQAAPTAAPSAAPRAPEDLIKLAFPNAEIAFSNYGGVLKSWRLTDKRYEHDKTKGELLPQQTDTGAFLVSFPGSTYTVPPTALWTGKKESDTRVVYSLTTDGLSLDKTFELVPASYIVKVTLHVKVLGKDGRENLAVSTFGYHDPKDSGGGGKSVQPRVWESSTLRDSEHLQTGVKAVIEHPRFEYNIRWSGFEHPFLLAAIAPKPVPGWTFDKQTYADATGMMRTDILFHPALAQPETTVELVGYFGPKNYNELDNAAGAAGFPAGFKETIDLGWFAFIGRPLMWLLLKFYGFVGNWGLAIMLLTLLVKALTVPFTTRSMRSMKAIAVLAPELKGLQEKYKDDRQRLQMETMALYKQHGANPLSGCLPIFLQMPIWLALYRMLSSTGELYQQPFIHGWINDLTAADPTHVLPVALMVTMFAQARLQPSAPSTDPAQKMQQRMMQYGLPLMFGVMSFFFPAGLALYIFTNTCLSAVHSIWMNKFDKKSLALTAKIEAAKKKAEAEKNKAAAAKAKSANVDEDADDDDGDDEAADDGKAIVKAGGSKPAPRPGQNRSKRNKKRRR